MPRRKNRAEIVPRKGLLAHKLSGWRKQTQGTPSARQELPVAKTREAEKAGRNRPLTLGLLTTSLGI